MNGDYLPSLNRNALVVSPGEGYLAWARTCPDVTPDLDIEGHFEGGTVYLLPEMKAGPERWLQRNYAAIFEEELESWHRDPEGWPQNRTHKMFKQFFKTRFCSMVFDLGKEPLEAE